MAKYIKNPDKHVVFLPGLGRLRDGVVLEGDKYERFTQDMFGNLLVPYTGPKGASSTEGKAAQATPATPKFNRPSVRSATLEGVMAEFEVPADQEEALLKKAVENGLSGKSVKKGELEQAARDLGFGVEETESVEESADSVAGDDDEGGTDSHLTEAELAAMSIPEMKEIAKLNDVELPKGMRKKAEIHDFLHKTFFGDEE